MAKTVTTVTTVTLSGDNFGGSPFFNESVTNTSAVAPSSVALLSGFNSITVPATAIGVVIVPPPGNTVPLVLRGVSGDTGVPIAPANSTRLQWTPAQVPSFGITTTGPVMVELIWL